MKHIPESDYLKKKKRHKQNTPTLGKIIKIIKTKQSITKQTNNQVNKQTNKHKYVLILEYNFGMFTASVA
jgi:hypothetical protein